MIDKFECKELEMHNGILIRENNNLRDRVDFYRSQLETAYNNDSYWKKVCTAFTSLLLITITGTMWVWIIYRMLILLTN